MSLEEIRTQHEGFRWSIADLPFTHEQKEVILEYLASQYWSLLERIDPTINSGGWKHYDPLTIRNGVALSYVLELEDGGRRHAFRSLEHLEAMLLNEVVGMIQGKEEED